MDTNVIGIHYSLSSNFYTDSKVTFLLYSSIMSFTSSETFKISTVYCKICISYFEIHSLYHFTSDYIYSKISLVISCAPDIPSCSLVSANTRDDHICCILYQLKFLKNRANVTTKRINLWGSIWRKGQRKEENKISQLHFQMRANPWMDEAKIGKKMEKKIESKLEIGLLEHWCWKKAIFVHWKLLSFIW